MTFFDTIFLITSVVSSAIISLVLFFRKSGRAFVNRLLGIALAGITWYFFTMLVFQSGAIRSMRYIIGTGVPTFYLVPPLCFLYVQKWLSNETSLAKRDWLHFLPSAIGWGLLVSFYADQEGSRITINSIVANENALYTAAIGPVSNIWHFVLRPIQGISYAVAQGVLLAIFLSKKRKANVPYTTLVEGPIRWLVVFTLIEFFAYLLLALATVHGYPRLLADPIVFRVFRVEYMPIFLGIAAVVSMAIYLFFSPEILYGFGPLAVQHRVADDVTAAAIPEIARQESRKNSLDEDVLAGYALRVEQGMIQKELFRSHGISINQLSEEVGISPRNLSYLLNTHYQQRFTDFINTYRVNYICSRMEKNDWRELTLEGLAREAGFSSRSSFSSVFKKVTGYSPSEYLQKLTAESVAG